MREYFREQILTPEMKHLRKVREEVNRFCARCELVTVRAPTVVLACNRHETTAIKMVEETAKQINDARFWVSKGGVDPSNMVAPDLLDCRVMESIKR